MSIPNPIFTKKLSKTDVKNRLAIPMKNLQDFPVIPEGQNDVLVPVMDEAGRRERRFRLSKRKGGHPKPVISSEHWNSYVREKQLREGDRITFYKENDEANEEIIRVCQPVMLFGEIIGRK